jgi:hypothetical protein
MEVVRETRTQHRPLTPGDPFGPVLLNGLFHLTCESMMAAVTNNSLYREQAAYQWARLLAQRAREYDPSLREGA